MENVSVDQAHAMQRDDGYTYVDVRSVPEYESGHPAGAVNIPVMHYDVRYGDMTPNADFLSVMTANFKPSDKLLLGCQAGVRSAHAGHLLESAGFRDVVNVEGGYGGVRNRMTGAVIAPGWAESGLPVEEGAAAGGSYEELRAKAHT